MSLQQQQPESTILDVENLHVEFDADRKTVHAIRGVDFQIEEGEIFGIVGESGSGKSVTALSLMGLLDAEGTITDGSITYRDADVLAKSGRELRSLRGDEISMVFQDPLNGLNPTLDIGTQVREAFSEFTDAPLRRLLGGRLPGNSSTDRDIIEVLQQVGIPNPGERLDSYPHEFSGGMRQRVMIAIAIAAEPELLIVDEPTTALDVTTQANIIGLLQRLRRELDITVLVISHDMGVIAQLCDRVAVMYAGEMMEVGPTEAVLLDPKHPYTDRLLASMPQRTTDGSLHSIDGTVPNLFSVPSGCVFADRCPNANDDCWDSNPEFAPVEGRDIACYYPVGDSDE